MESRMDRATEQALVKLINEVEYKKGIYLDEYQKVEFHVYTESIITEILHVCKFKELGNVYDYPEILPQPDSIDGFDLSANFEMFQKVAVSKKFNSVCLYTIERHGIHCTFLIDTEYLKKFSKKTKAILQQDTRANMFRGIEFECEENEYIEISDATGDSMKPADVLKKKVEKEKLVFDENSAIVEVMNDITTFFKKETEELYAKLQIPHKRGVIVYGDPGNGKSAMNREIIRLIKGIAKIVINPNVSCVTRILSSLLKSLNGKRAIIIIEDIDSLITPRNRSDFLNILDGVDIKSGVYFIGTTNYFDKIDPAFMNRAGRFDRTFEIGNPSDATRRKFFESRDVGGLLAEYKVYKDENIPDSDGGVVELFVKYSSELPMASLKELITSTAYILAGADGEMTVEEGLEKSSGILTKSKADHKEAHDNYNTSKLRRMASRWDDDDDDD